MTERRNWAERNIFHQDTTAPYERVRFQAEKEKIYTGRIEVYTGHGLQKVGMGLDLWEQSSLVRDLYSLASEEAGFDVAALSFEGPEDLLNRTEYAQVTNATFSKACKAMLVEDKPLRFNKYPRVTTGQSAGFGLAVYEAGGFGNPYEKQSFRKMIRFYRDRGLIMQEVSDSVGGGLIVVGVRKKRGESATDDQIGYIAQIREQCREFGVGLALDVSSDQVILGGSNMEIAGFEEVVKDRYEPLGIRAIRSKASSGPFHIERLMSPADGPIRELVQGIGLEDPKSLVVANTQKKFLSTKEEIEEELGDLTIKPVLGRDMDSLVAENCRGIMYFVGGDRAIAQDMFVESVDGKKPIYRSKKAIITLGLTAASAGAAIAIAAHKKRSSNKDQN